MQFFKELELFPKKKDRHLVTTTTTTKNPRTNKYSYIERHMIDTYIHVDMYTHKYIHTRLIDKIIFYIQYTHTNL